MMPPYSENVPICQMHVKPPFDFLCLNSSGSFVPAVQNAGMIGEIIRRLRKEANLTQEDLAERTGMSHSFISRLERDDRNLRVDHIETIAAALGVHASVFFQKTRAVPVMGYVGAGAQVEPEIEQVPEGGIEEIQLPFPVPDDVIAFQVRGDSMLPRYDDGDYILVFRSPRRALDTFINEEALVRTTDGKRYVKVIDRSGDRIDLRSWNARTISDVSIEWIGQIYMRVPASLLRVH